MAERPFDLIAFDGDDTLWHNERSYRDARERFRRLLAAAGVDLTDDEIEDRVSETEVANLEFYGYGVSSFVLSLIETAIRLTSGRITGAALHELIDVAKAMLSEEVELFPAARDTIIRLAARYALMLITKGDLLHQTSKLERSGLRPYFSFVEVVSHKTPDVYAALLSRHRIDPSRFLMVGNSLRSDVLPVVELGGRAAYVPAVLSWAHEHADVPERVANRYVELSGLDAVAEFIERLENAAQTSSIRT